MQRRAQFVAGEAVGETVKSVETLKRSGGKVSERLSVQTSERSRAIQLRADGREVRRHTIYLPILLAKSLAHYCVEHDKDLSTVVAEAVSKLVAH